MNAIRHHQTDPPISTALTGLVDKRHSLGTNLNAGAGAHTLGGHIALA